ncbi:MAG: hypothetical protein FD177_645 [Desulfovibrionaceae bacterium]|nr:MAG: hypothetical protein FD177_645 [Desulfovibrionaceae bacterium]
MNVMILGGKAEPAAVKPCAVHLELEARLARIEACVAALEKALGSGSASGKTTGTSPKVKARTAAANQQ